MRRFIQGILPILSQNPHLQSENNKISYWLEKLFIQQKFENEKNNNHTTENLALHTQIIKASTEEKGLAEATQNIAKKEETDRQRVEDMVKNSNHILMSLSSVFPWDIFPSILNIEATRITIIHRQFLTSQVHSVDIKDISNVFIDTGFLFASLKIVSITFGENEVEITRLWKKDAILGRRIIEGLRMFVKEDIHTASYSSEELISKLKELSTTKIVI